MFYPYLRYNIKYQQKGFNMKKVIPNTENLYFATNDGKIYKNDKLVSQHLDRKENGYYQCAIKINGKYQKQKVHRLIAMTFIGNVEKMTVNHIDGNKLNNKADNLEIISHYDNVQHGKSLPSFMESKKKAGLENRALNNIQVDELLSLRNKMSLRELGKKFKINPSTVSSYIKKAGLTKQNKCINQYA